MAVAHDGDGSDVAASISEPQSSSSALTEGNKRHTRRRPKQVSHVVAAFVELALWEKQQEEEQAQVAQRRRRKRAVRKRKPDAIQLQGQEMNRINAEDTANGAVCTPHNTQDTLDESVVVIDNLVGSDELQDSDEYNDVVADLESEFALYKGFTSLQVDRGTGAVTLTFADCESAGYVVDAKHGKLFGGREIAAHLVTAAPFLTNVAGVEQEGKSGVSKHVTIKQAANKASTTIQQYLDASVQKKPKRRSKCKSAVLREHADKKKASEQLVNFSKDQTSFLARNLVHSDEVEDDDEYEEIKSETTSDFEQFGELVQLQILRGTDDTQEVSIGGGALRVTVGDVVLRFQSHASALAAFNTYDGKMFGGRLVECKWIGKDASSAKIQVDNLLEPNELQDFDEFEDIQDDTRQTFQQYGDIELITICRETGSVTIVYQAEQSARNAIEKMNGSTHGGRKVLARLVEDSVQSRNVLSSESSETRRVLPVLELSQVEIVAKFLKRLASLQERAHHQNSLQDKRSRRLVLGLHEVKRGVLAKKICLLIVGTDIEQCDVLDEKLDEILAIATKQEVPIIYPMSRRKLGRVLSKSVRVSCVGVYSMEGANDLFQDILKFA